MTGTPLRTRPRLFIFEDLVGPEARAVLSQALAVPRLLDAGFEVRYGPMGRTAEVPPDHHPALSELAERLAAIVGLPSAVPLSFRVRHAAPGDAHPPHTDAYDTDGARLVATAMIYLDVETCAGGATVFPQAEPPLRLDARPGRVAIWFNYGPDARPDPASTHLMERVEAGQRLTMNLFFYARPDDLPRATGLAAGLGDAPSWTAPRATLTCVDDTAAPASAASLARACQRRGLEFRHVSARQVDPREAPLAPGSLLYCVSTTPAAARVERQLWQPGVRTFYRDAEGPFGLVLDPLRRLARAGLPVPRSVVLEPGGSVALDDLVAWLGGFPVVVKAPGGEGGVGTMRADSMPALRGLVDLLCARGLPATLLAYVPDAMHLRVVVVGDRAVTAYRNPVAAGDFRSRPSDDAADYGIALDAEVAEVAVAAAHTLGTDFAGVDVLTHESGRLYVLEANFPCYFPQAERFGAEVALAMVDHLAGLG